jgi:hypothetical protein
MDLDGDELGSLAATPSYRHRNGARLATTADAGEAASRPMCKAVMLPPLMLRILLPCLLPLVPIGDDPPPGPPWKLTYRDACLDAIAHGRPVFVYFSKTY